MTVAKRVQPYAPVIAVVVLIGLSLWLWADFKKPVSEPGENPKVSEVIGMLPADVSEIQIENSAGKIDLKKQGAAWTIEQPAHYAADADAAKKIVDGLLDKTIDYLADAPKDLTKLGLDKPQATVTLFGKGSRQQIEIGGKDVTGSSLYATDPAIRKVFLVSSSDADSVLGKSAADLRDKTLLAVPEDKLESVKIEKPGGVIEIDRGPDRKWSLAQPIKAPADDFAASDVAGAFHALKAARFVDAAQKPAAGRALAKPEITVTLREAGGAMHVLRIGPKPLGSQDRYSRLGDRPDDLALISVSSVRAFDKSVGDLRSRQIVDFDLPQVTSLEVSSSTAGWSVEKKGADWQIVKPAGGGKAKAEVIEGILSDLKTPASSVAGDPAPSELAKYGLDHATVTGTITLTGGVRKTYLIGSKSGSNYYAKSSDAATVYKIAPFTLNGVNKPLAAIK
jgi:hypothetical protein